MYETTNQHYTAKRIGEKKEDLLILANFTARIAKQTRKVDGLSDTVELTIVGETGSGKLPPVKIDAKKFESMSWVTELWGYEPTMFPEANVKAEMQTAIRMMSKDVERETIYQHTGWIEDEGKHMFLHANGAIGKDGNDESYSVHLPADLQHYSFQTLDVDARAEMREAWMASVRLKDLAAIEKMAPMLAAAWRAPIKASDFGVHCTGRTGSFKSEVTSLIISHFGREMDARHLPGSWSSTANALEALAYRAKDVIFVIDDFIPTGTTWQRQQYNAAADRLFRALGNQSGRARLTDVSSLQETMFPRSLVVSSGEDTPEGQSLRGRMQIVELSKGDVCTDVLTECQKNRYLLEVAMAGYIEWLARGRDAKLERFQDKVLEYRDVFKGFGHSRTPAMSADLLAAVEMWVLFGLAQGFIEQEDADRLQLEFYEALKKTAADQTRFIVESDPCEAFIATLKSGFMSQSFHLKSIDGRSPDMPHLFGWAEDTSGSVYSYKPRGTHIGWIDEQKETIYLDHRVGYQTIVKQSGGSLSLTESTLWKRLKEGGIINAVDEKRSRNTVRITIAGEVKTVASIDMTKIVEIAEAANDEGAF